MLLAEVMVTVKARGLPAFSQAAIDEVAAIQAKLKDMNVKPSFMLRQPQDEMARVKKKALMVDVLRNATMQTLFP